MHSWGDGFDFDRLDRAHNIIYSRVKRLSGCYLMSKEKYGTIRYEHVFPPNFRWLRIRSPTKVTNMYGTYRPYLFTWDTCWLYRKWRLFGWKVLVRVVQEVIEDFPDMEDELMQDLACNEELVGKEVHDKYWTRVGKGDS